MMTMAGRGKSNVNLRPWGRAGRQPGSRGSYRTWQLSDLPAPSYRTLARPAGYRTHWSLLLYWPTCLSYRTRKNIRELLDNRGLES
jgi:hypothetical protein